MKLVEEIHERPATVTKLMFKDEYNGITYDFCESLVNTCGGNFTMDEAKEEALESIRDSLMANSAAVHRLIALNPSCANRYWQQHAESEEALKQRIIKLKIIGVYVEP